MKLSNVRLNSAQGVVLGLLAGAVMWIGLVGATMWAVS